VTSRPFALARDEGDAYPAGVTFLVKADEHGTTNGAAVMEYVTRAGEEPQPHVHATEDEMFYVQGGDVTFRCGDETFDVGDGGFVFLPQGIEHEYVIRSDGPVRLLVITSPPRPDSDGWSGFIGGMRRRFGPPSA
jgi:mannose-6-phosphate isomerase-like protein (cupin superfamily)